MSPAIGRVLKLDDAALRELVLAGMLLDLGKVGFSDALLDKPFPARIRRAEDRSRRIPRAEVADWHPPLPCGRRDSPSSRGF